MAPYSRFQPFSVVDIPDDVWNAQAAQWRAAQDNADGWSVGDQTDPTSALRQARMPHADWQFLRAQQLAAPDDTVALGADSMGGDGEDALAGGAGDDRLTPRRAPLTGRPGMAATVAGVVDGIASAPNTAGKLPPGRLPLPPVNLRRGAAQDISADAHLPIGSVHATGVLDPPTGRPEVSISDIASQGPKGFSLPQRVRLYNTPTGELDVDIGPGLKVPLPLLHDYRLPAGTYVIK